MYTYHETSNLLRKWLTNGTVGTLHWMRCLLLGSLSFTERTRVSGYSKTTVVLSDQFKGLRPQSDGLKFGTQENQSKILVRF